MARHSSPSKIESLALPKVIEAEVKGWRSQGYSPFPSETTRHLLRHWFDREHDEGARFHEAQQTAIETIIYLHELRGVRTLRDVYEQFAPERLKLFKSIADEVAVIPFPKYCVKAATGSGKTWVLAALVAWQYFNALHGESNAPYSYRFMVVTPGLEVRGRILDSFLGRRDPRTGNRDPGDKDLAKPLFMPEGADWRDRFDLTVLEPGDIRSNASPPDGAFVAVTNWQQFALPRDKPSLAEEIGLVTPDEPQGEIVADFMTTYPDLVVMNDEAHHVHGKKTAKADELVWRCFMAVLDRRMRERHGDSRGLFLQLDFSATPFYGSGPNREYFPHIVCDFDLREALNRMLVKQLFLEERQKLPGQAALEDLDFKAVRDDKNAVVKLSPGQRQIIDIGLSKLNQLTGDFANKGLGRKPVLMILCEDTAVADFVHDYLLACKDFEGELFKPRNLLAFHSELTKENHGYTIDDARRSDGTDKGHATLDSIDVDDDPLRVVVSVLALREGFDKTNICVIAALRATEADLLLEQIVGRGLRLMFPGHKYPELQEAKKQAFDDLSNRLQPQNSLDFLYVVEHPRFRTFYDDLRKQGYLIAGGDSSRTTATGDLLPVDAAPERLPLREIAWPLAIQEEGGLPDLSKIDVMQLAPGSLPIEDVRKAMASIAITDRDLRTDTRASTWDLRDPYFDYEHFLSTTARIIATQGKQSVLSGRLAEIAALVDDYCSRRLFRGETDFRDEHNYKVLAYAPIKQHVIDVLKAAVRELLGQPSYEVRTGVWRRLSDLPRLLVREAHSVPALRCPYPRVGFAARFGGFERLVMETTLDGSPEVLAWCKLQRKHNLTIAYRDESGLLRNYEVDFLLRTAESCFILETKSDRDMSLPNVAFKARAAKRWCESITGIAPPAGLPQPAAWEYLLLDESTYKDNQGASFTALLPLARRLRDKVIAQGVSGKLFA